MVINAVTVKYTIPAFEEMLPMLPKDCIISDIFLGEDRVEGTIMSRPDQVLCPHTDVRPYLANLTTSSLRRCHHHQRGD